MREGWKQVMIADLCKIKSGKGVPAAEIIEVNIPGTFPCYGGNGQRGYIGKYSYDGTYPIIGRVGALCGNIHLATGKFYATEHALVCSIHSNTDAKFLCYLFLNMNLRQYAQGAAQPVLSAGYISNLATFIPSLPEQQRIVDILDREFAKIDALKVNAEKSLQAAKDLFQATLKKELKPKEGWKTACLDDICRIVGRIGFRGYTRNDIVSSPDDGAISLSPSNIVEGEMKYDKLTYISWFKYDESPEIKIFNGDILLVKTGSSYGKSAVIKDLPHEATINPQLVVLKDIKIDTQFLHFFLSADNARKKFDEFVSGTAIPTFSQRNLGQMLICFPNPEKTKEIVAKLNNLQERLTAFQQNFQKTLALCDDLKQALLHKAFNGEL